jgi:hypothetical protein
LQIGVELVRRGLAGVTKANRLTLLRNRAESRPRQMPGAPSFIAAVFKRAYRLP